MSLPAIPFETEEYVVVAIVGELADTSVLHTPAPYRTWNSGIHGNAKHLVSYESATRNGLPPSTWPSACGAVERGVIYVRGGPLKHVPACAACAAALPTERRPLMSVVAVPCKVDGCEESANTRYDRGVYVRLCERHIEARRAELTGATPRPASRSGGASTDSMVALVRSLTPHARKLDAAGRKLASAGSNEKLQAEFAEASRRAQAAPIVENLERLEKATKALRRGAPKRQEAQNAYDKAEREFKLKLGEIARELRAA